MKKSTLILCLTFFFTLSLKAQYSFKILAAKGINQVFRKGNWSTAKAGTKLLSSEKIKLSKNGYLGLIHSSGKTLELKEAGEFTVENLEKKIVVGRSGFGSKYGKFVADGMFSANKNANKSYNKTGSISRNINNKIIVYAPLKMDALKGVPFSIHWNNCGAEHTYILTLKNLFNEEVFSKEFSSNYAIIDFNDASIPEVSGGIYLLEITSKTDPSFTTTANGVRVDNNYQIKLLESDKESEIFDTTDEIAKSIDKTNALDYMILAMAYEKAGLMTYAVESYYIAKQLAPDVRDYDIQYEEYIKAKLGISDLKNK